MIFSVSCIFLDEYEIFFKKKTANELYFVSVYIFYQGTFIQSLSTYDVYAHIDANQPGPKIGKREDGSAGLGSGKEGGGTLSGV